MNEAVNCSNESCGLNADIVAQQ